jgi:hypothetical protein
MNRNPQMLLQISVHVTFANIVLQKQVTWLSADLKVEVMNSPRVGG